MSLFGTDMSSGVREELCRRAKIIPSGYGPWTHARIPWARVSPCVHIVGKGDSHRVSSILFGGKLNTLNKSYNVNTNNRLGPYGSSYEGSKRNTPEPGITSVKVEEKGTMGGIKKVTIDFNVWDHKQLLDYELNVMTLGKHLMVEWGWNVDTKGSSVATNLGGSQTDVSRTDSDLSCVIRSKQSKEKFNYDCIRGLITNFNWSINSFGGFDCTIEVTSKGTTYLSTPTETATMHSGCDEDPDDTREDADADKVHRPNMEQPFAFLRQRLKKTWDDEVPLENSNAVGKGYIGMAAVFDKELGFMDWVAAFFSSEPTNAELDYYITWDYFEEYVVNRKLAPIFDSLAPKTDTGQSDPGQDKCSGAVSNNPQVWRKIWNKWRAAIDIQPRKKDLPYMLDSRGSVLRNSGFLMSADPMKCLLPGQEHWRLAPIRFTGVGSIMAWIGGQAAYAGGYLMALPGAIDVSASWSGISVSVDWQACEDAAEAAQKEAEDDINMAMADKNVQQATVDLMAEFRRFDPENGNGTGGKGLLSNMMLNLAFIEETVNDSDDLSDFMDTILKGISDSCGNYWDLLMVEDPDNAQVIRVIDQNYRTESTEVNGFWFNGIGRKSVARAISIETDIDSKMAAMVMYGSNKKEEKQNMGGQAATEYAIWGKGVTDLVLSDIAMRDSKGQEPGVDCCNTSVAGDSDVLKHAWGGYFKSAEEVANEVNEDSTEGMNTSMKKLLYMADPHVGFPSRDGTGSPTKHTGGDTTITIPLKVSLTIDGISGLKWGNIFGFDKHTPLPKRYLDYSFQITKVEHEITPEDWTTSVNSIMRPYKCKGSLSGISNCSSNQGSLPGGIVPTTADVIDFDIIEVLPEKDPDTDPDLKKDVEDGNDPVDMIKLEMIPVQLIPNEIEMDGPTKVPCPCQDGSFHMDCCDGVTPSDDDDIILVTPIIPIDPILVTGEKTGCQCPDGSFNESCCPHKDPEPKTTITPLECKIDKPPDIIPTPGKTDPIETTIITNNKKPPEDVIIEDVVEEEDCEDWGKLGAIAEQGNIIFWPQIFYKDVWYYELRRHQKYCFYYDLYLWHGKDSETGKPAFSAMYPPSSMPVKNLFGIYNLFSAEMINRRSSLKSVMQVTGRKKKIVKANSNIVKYDIMYGIADTQKSELTPGEIDSPGLYHDTHIKFFRSDQPYEAWGQGWANGGMKAWNKWNEKKGKANYVVHGQNRSNGSETWLQKAIMERMVMAVRSPFHSTLINNYKSFMKGYSGDVQKNKSNWGNTTQEGMHSWWSREQLLSQANKNKKGRADIGWNPDFLQIINAHGFENAMSYKMDYGAGGSQDEAGWIINPEGVAGTAWTQLIDQWNRAIKDAEYNNRRVYTTTGHRGGISDQTT